MWINRDTSGRSKADPLGRVWLKGVELANLIVVRCMLLILLASARKVHWVLEQPASSIMFWMPRFQEVARTFPVYEALVHHLITSINNTINDNIDSNNNSDIYNISTSINNTIKYNIDKHQQYH